MFTSTTVSNQSQIDISETSQETKPSDSLWSAISDYELTNSQPEPLINPNPELFCSDHNTSFLFGVDHTLCDPHSMERDGNTNFRLDLRSFFGSPDVPLQRSWTSNDPWKEEYECGGREDTDVSAWSSRAGVVGGVVQRANAEWTQRAQTKSDMPFNLDSTFSYSPILQQSATSYMYSFQHSDSQYISSSLSTPPEVLLWNHSTNPSNTGGTMTVSANYGTKCWTGQERKRSGGAAGMDGTFEWQWCVSILLRCCTSTPSVYWFMMEYSHDGVWKQVLNPFLCFCFAALTPLKKGRLSYERVPGRSDGQTRLKLF